MVRILDSTLREGEQSPGVHFSPASKVRIAQLLDQVGVDVIEAGNPSVDPSIAQVVTTIARTGLRARIGAHARCRLDDVETALACEPTFLGVFLSLSEGRLERDYRLTFDQSLERIRVVVSHARAASGALQIRFTIEDAVRTPLARISAAAVAAMEAGADIISLADTTGFASPFSKKRSLGQMVERVKKELSQRKLAPQIEVHCHNDRGLALANALEAYQVGAEIIDTAVLGLGERVGIVDLAELLVNLRETFGEGAQWDFRCLAPLYEEVSKGAGVPIARERPIMGEHAFTHSAGVHINALAHDPDFYQSLDPTLFGRSLRFTLGPQSGSASVELALRTIGRENLIIDKDLVAKILEEVKTRTLQGLPITLKDEFPALVTRLTAAQ